MYFRKSDVISDLCVLLTVICDSLLFTFLLIERSQIFSSESRQSQQGQETNVAGSVITQKLQVSVTVYSLTGKLVSRAGICSL